MRAVQVIAVNMMNTTVYPKIHRICMKLVADITERNPREITQKPIPF